MLNIFWSQLIFTVQFLLNLVIKKKAQTLTIANAAEYLM